MVMEFGGCGAACEGRRGGGSGMAGVAVGTRMVARC